MNKTRYAVLALILVVIFCAFCPSLHNDFATWDDDGHLIKNASVRSLSGPNIAYIFRDTVNDTYIPLTIFSFALEYHFFGYNPFVYHLNNIILHLAVVALMFFLALRFALSVPAAALAALFFGIHPMHVESVAWVTERKDVLYAFFYLLAIHQYLNYTERKSIPAYWASVGLTLLSILSKPMALSLPLILLVCDWFKGRKFDVKIFVEKIPFFICVVPVAWVTYALNARVPGGNAYEGALTWTWTFVFYIRKFIYPGLLLPIYNLPQPVALTNPEFISSSVLFLGMIVLLVRFWKNKHLAFAFLFYFVSIFFLLRFDDRADVNVVADRFMYLPSLGFCFFFAVFFEQITAWAKKKTVFLHDALWVAVVVLFFVLGARTFAQNRTWGDGVALWSKVIELYPRQFAAYDHRGYAYGKKGMLDDAILDYTKAININPKYDQGYNNRGVAYSLQGKFDQALADFTRALELRPEYPDASFNRGIVYSQTQQFAAAVADYNKVLEVSPNHPEALGNRGVAFLLQGDYQNALRDFDHAVAMNPRDVFAINNRAIIYVQKNELDRALADFSRLIKLNPHEPSAYYNRGLVYFRQQSRERALADFNQALRIDPGHKKAAQKKAELEEKIRQ